jgi:hypothetical protein
MDGMSDAQTAGKAARRGPSRARKVFALLFALVAIGLFAAAFVYADGMTYVDRLVTQVSNLAAQLSPAPAPQPSVAATSTPTAAETSSTLLAIPAAMRDRLFYEQVSCQQAIEDLVDGEFTALTVDSATVTSETATLRVTATHKLLPTYQGTIVFTRVADMWLFTSLDRDGSTATLPTRPAVDTAIVDAIIQQHAANQAVLADLLAGGYRTLTVTSVQKGPNTASLQITMSGGNKPERAGGVLLISKSLEGATYWFVTAFR